MEEMTYKEYSKTLSISEEICTLLLGKPTTSREIAERFNQVGAVNKVIIDKQKSPN
jgi:hypothetical protein